MLFSAKDQVEEVEQEWAYVAALTYPKANINHIWNSILKNYPLTYRTYVYIYSKCHTEKR